MRSKKKRGSTGGNPNSLILMLNEYKGRLTGQQIRTIKGQILAGHVAEAMRGLNGILCRDAEERFREICEKTKPVRKN